MIVNGVGWPLHEVRRLLALVAQPKALEQDPVAISLREALACADAREALERLVDAAFESATSVAGVERNIIVLCDFERRSSKEVSARLHLSLRQFFRYRVKALEALAQALRGVLSIHEIEPQTLLLESLAEIDPERVLGVFEGRNAALREERYALAVARINAWQPFAERDADGFPAFDGALLRLALGRRYELYGDGEGIARVTAQVHAAMAQLDERSAKALAFGVADLLRVDALARGDLSAVARHTASLQRNAIGAAGRESRLMYAGVAVAELQALRREPAEARHALTDALASAPLYREIWVLTYAAFVEAVLQAGEGDHAHARELLRHTRLALAHRPDIYGRGQALEGLLALQAGESWQPAARPPALFFVTRYGALVRAVWARHLLEQGEGERARVVADEAATVAEGTHAPLIAAYARAYRERQRQTLASPFL
ncbi:hypothetical protein EPN52_11705 [bacterium]|nr:MAG: hypothetical protein EPN52_11705 [bacterium]